MSRTYRRDQETGWKDRPEYFNGEPTAPIEYEPSLNGGESGEQPWEYYHIDGTPAYFGHDPHACPMCKDSE